MLVLSEKAWIFALTKKRYCDVVFITTALNVWNNPDLKSSKINVCF